MAEPTLAQIKADEINVREAYEHGTATEDEYMDAKLLRAIREAFVGIEPRGGPAE